MLQLIALLCACFIDVSNALSLDVTRRDFINKVAGISAAAASGIIAPRSTDAADISSSSSPTTICVTGANGYIGLHCVSQLLQNGYSVRAAVRSTSTEKTKYLTAIAKEVGATDKLSFASIDLFDVDSLMQAGKGCDAMLHLASPFSLKNSGDPMKSIVEPAVAGATNAVRAAEGLGLRRLVACGSVFGMVGSGTEKGFDHVYGSDDVNGFNTLGGCAYAYSKRVSQQESIALASDKGVDLVTLNVGQVCGPALSPDQSNPSWEPFRLLATPQPGGAVLSASVPGFVDVRDVAAAHISALRLPASKQPRRYAVAARKESPTYVEITEIMASILPERNFPAKVEALPPSVQKLVVKGIKLSDKSLGELIEGVSIPNDKTLLIDIDPMLKDLVPKPREIRTTLFDWLENQKAYGHAV